MLSLGAFMSNEVKRKFIGDAVNYQKFRPDYPQKLFIALLKFWKQISANYSEPVIADIGCGTGIATRGIYYALKKKCKVIGIEPDHNMLEQAKKTTSNIENIIYLQGNAEILPFEDKSLDIIIAAQAMQYFDRPIFYHEARRILKSYGVIAILENNRNWKDSLFLEKYEEFLEKNSYDKNLGCYSRDYRNFPFIEELNNYFKNATEKIFHWSMKIDPQDFLEMVKSTTSAQRVISNIGKENAERQLLELTCSHLNKDDGLLEIPYIAKLYLARNR